MSAQTDVLIIGGGLAGIACAVGLVGSGLRTTLLEEQSALAGRARSWRDDTTGDVVDIGPHILLTEYRNLLSLLETLGTRERVFWQKDKLITLLSDRGRTAMRTHRLTPPLHLVPSMLKVTDVSARDKLSNASAVWFAMTLNEHDVQALDAEPATDLLRRLHVSQRFIDWFWKSVAMSLMNVPLEHCSSGALMRFFAQFIGHNEYRIGFARCGLAELFLPAAARMIVENGGVIRTNTAARALAHSNQVCEGAILEDGSRIDARWCVAAVPPSRLHALAPDGWRESPPLRQLPQVRPSPYISVYLWFDRKLTTEPFWARVWSPSNLNYDFYDLSNIREGWSGRASVIASNIVHSDRAEPLSDAEIVAITLRELADFAPEAQRAKLIHRRVHRIPMAIPCPHPGTERIRPPTVTPFHGLLLAGDWTRTEMPASMESAVRSGFLGAEHILAAIGRPRKLALPVRPTEGLAGIARQLAQWRRAHAGRA